MGLCWDSFFWLSLFLWTSFVIVVVFAEVVFVMIVIETELQRRRLWVAYKQFMRKYPLGRLQLLPETDISGLVFGGQPFADLPTVWREQGRRPVAEGGAVADGRGAQEGGGRELPSQRWLPTWTGQEHHPGRVCGRVRLCLLKRKPGQRCKDSRTSSLGRTDAAKNVFYALPKFMLRLCNKFQFPPYKLYNCARQEALLRL